MVRLGLRAAVLTALFSLPLHCTAALAQATMPTLFSGSWRELIGADTQAEDPAEDVLILRSRLDFDLQHPLADDARVHLGARLWHVAAVGHEQGSYMPAFRAHFPDLGMRYDAVADLRQAYVQWDTRLGQLTVGRDIVSWGAMEIASPFRILNPADFSQGLIGSLGQEESNLLPDMLVRLVRPLGPGSLDLVFLPFFTQHRFSPFATDTAMLRPDLGPSLPATLWPLLRHADLRLDRSLGDTLMQALQPPPATPLQGSVAARWQLRMADWDLAAVAIWNWDRLPILRVNPDLAVVLARFAQAGFDRSKQIALAMDPQVTAAEDRLNAAGTGPTDLIQAQWQRRLTTGVQASGELGNGFSLHSDVAVSPKVGTALGRVLLDTQFQAVRTGIFQAGLGVAYQRDDWLTLIVEGNYQYAMDVPETTKLFLSARHQVTLAGGGVARLGPGQPWTLQLGGMYGVTLGDWAVLPHVAYEVADNWRLGLGAVVMGGDVGTPGGLFKTDNQVLLDLRRAF